MFNFRYIQYKFVAVLKYMIELNAAVGILTPIVAENLHDRNAATRNCASLQNNKTAKILLKEYLSL